MKRFRLLPFLIILSLAAACDPDRFFEQQVAIPEGKWKLSEPATFTVEIPDTIQLYSFYLNIRNSVDYRYENVFFFIRTLFPNQEIAIDTVECLLANAEGRWYGSGWGKLKDNRLLFKRGVRFPQAGTYTFRIEQAMREDPLDGIYDIGLRIEHFRYEK
ncbi:MAG: gliding motility lipoprotein GldH [Bacteroidetes bacterium]|nr:gliding motility lipoprotein GldH [Bacteroidota bacterium]